MTANQTSTTIDSEWVDDVLLKGAADTICLQLPEPVRREALRRMVADRQADLAAAGLRPGGAAALRLPPSLAYVVHLLAVWRTGAQAILLDHRLTDHEVAQALERLHPQVVVAPVRTGAGALRIFHDVDAGISRYGDRPAGSDHAVVQLSSGSTGPSKVIARTAADLVTEVRRYTRIDGVPLPGERIVLLPSMVHVLGLVGGLMYGLHAGITLVPPRRLTGEAILEAVAAGDSPATVLGVPFHIGLVASTKWDAPLPQFKRMTTGGELVPASTSQAFEERFGVPLGNMYGMTEVGVIGTDLYGRHRPSIQPAPGIGVREIDGELWISAAANPYLGLSDPSRWRDGWLRTKDAGAVDPATGLVTVKGRLDSQVSVGGMKVDLTEVEQALAALPEVEVAVVLFDNGITGYVQPSGETTEDALHDRLAERLASFKRPTTLHLLAQLPRTTTGKVVRDPAALRRAVS